MRSNYFSYPRSRRRLDEAQFSGHPIIKAISELTDVNGKPIASANNVSRAMDLVVTYLGKIKGEVEVNGEAVDAQEYVITQLLELLYENPKTKDTFKSMRQQKIGAASQQYQGQVGKQSSGEEVAEESYYRRGRSLSENRSYSNRPSRRYW